MKLKMGLFLLLVFFGKYDAQSQAASQSPCSANPVYRQLDFWVGEWDVYNVRRNVKVADSKIEGVLDGCVVLENYQANGGYKGKSFTTFNDSTKQWQQTWVDNTGAIAEMRKGHAEENKMILVREFIKNDGSVSATMTRMTIAKVEADIIKQFGERSDDGGKTWIPTFNLEYRRKK